MQFKANGLPILITVLYLFIFGGALKVQCFGTKLQRLLQNIIIEQEILTIQLVHEHFHECDFYDILQGLQVPLLVWSARQETVKPPEMAKYFNQKLLSVVCLREGHNENLTKSLAASLEFLRLTHILFISSTYHKQPELQQLMAECKQYDMLNFIVVYRDFEFNSVYYTLQLFPRQALVRRNFETRAVTVIYPLTGKSLNLHGHSIAVAADWSEPRSILYTTPDGVDHMSGYMIKLVRAFASHLNGTLHFPYGKTKIYMRNMFALTRNRSIDMAASVTNPKLEMNMYEYTYPFEISEWFTMLPLEPPIPVNEIFFYVVSDWRCVCLMLLLWLVLIVWFRKLQHPCELEQILLNDVIWRALIAQSFVMPTHSTRKQKHFFIVVLLAGFVLSNIYLTYMNSILVDLPLQRRIKSFDDLRDAKLKILISTVELSALTINKGFAFWSKYRECFATTSSYDEFVQLRKSFNTSYGYTITSSLWPVFEQQQKYFSRRTFRAAHALVYDEFSLSAMPLQNNSIYKRDLDMFIMRVHDNGIRDYWFQASLGDMVASKRISLQDSSTKREYPILQWHDLYWIWLLFAGLNVGATIVFAIELFYFTIKSRRKS